MTVTLTDVTGEQGENLPSAAVTFGIIFGDVTADGFVDQGDLKAIQAVRGQTTDSANFRADLNSDGRINNRDVGRLKSFDGDHLP